MTIYQPRQTRHWSTRELDILIGRKVSILVGNLVSDGTVVETGIGRFGRPFVQFDSGTGVEWDRDVDEVTVNIPDLKCGDPYDCRCHHGCDIP